MRVDHLDLEALRRLEPPDLLRVAFEEFGDRAAIGTSLQKTGIIMIHLASRLDLPYRVFFIDTLLNPPETYELLKDVEARYGIQVERFCPDPGRLDELHEMFGQSAHYFARDLCCRVRKKLPLQHALATLDVWISGLRSDQSEFRRDNAAKAAFAPTTDGRRILKLNPLLDWSQQDVDAYIREHGLPYNRLYDFVSPFGERYYVIGCRPCHIPVKEHMDKRTGKFPWEHGKKECGIHEEGSGI